MVRHDLITSQFWFFNNVSDGLKSSRVSKESLCLSLCIVICRFIHLWNHFFFDRVPWDRSWWIHHAAQQSGSKQIWRSRDWKSSTNRYRPAKSVVLSLLRFNFCFGCYCFSVFAVIRCITDCILCFVPCQDSNFSTALELAVRFGKTLVIQEMDGVEPVLYPILRGDFISQGEIKLCISTSA